MGNMHKNWSSSATWFSSYPTDRQTNRHKNRQTKYNISRP